MFADNAPNWYATLIKPSFAPPSWLFGPVWSVLYILIAVAFIKTLKLSKNKKFKLAKNFLLVFVVNLLANFLFSPLQFGLQNNFLALIDILLVLGTLVWLVVKSYPKQKLIFGLLLPYLAWVSFATLLQISITWLNWA